MLVRLHARPCPSSSSSCLTLHAPHSTRRVSGSYQGGSGHHRACIRISRGESPRRRRGLLRASASAPSSGLKLLRTAHVIPDLERGNLPVTHHLRAMRVPSSAHSGVALCCSHSDGAGVGVRAGGACRGVDPGGTTTTCCALFDASRTTHRTDARRSGKRKRRHGSAQ